tara:strand:+ start:638 stop:1486 length:849 start_codon:yes stop_codon:yes gene_type:complete
MFTTNALTGHTYIIAGIANNKSLAYPIAQMLHAAGAKIVMISHPMNEKRASKIAQELDAAAYYCDVASDEELERCIAEVSQHAPFAGMLHAIAFSDKDELRGEFIDTSRQNFLRSLDISCFSFVDLARRLRPYFSEGASLLTLSFDASRGPYPHYNVMGIAKAALEAATMYLANDLGADGVRVNAINASPEDTLSARGIGNFRLIGDFAESMSPLGRRATKEEIATMAMVLLSPLGSGVTGQVIFVDAGSSVPNMPPARNAGKMATAMSKIAQTANQENTDG